MISTRILFLICSVSIASTSVAYAEKAFNNEKADKTNTTSKNKANAKDANASPLADGFYHVIRFSKNQEEVLPLHADEKLVEYDYHLLQEDEREPKEYEVLEDKNFVPIILDGDPQKDKDNKGRPNLLIKLSESQIKPLEDFTSKHLGSRVAIVIGNQIVTMHKIREAIKGGKVQISRCSDHGCEVIYTELQKDKK